MNYMIFIEWIRDNKLNTVKFYNAILTALQKKPSQLRVELAH